MNTLKFVETLSADAKTALAKGDIKTAEAMLHTLQQETIQLAAEHAANRFHIGQRLRGVLSLAEATGNISREQKKILHELRRLPATIDNALDSPDSMTAFARIDDVFRRINIHASTAHHPPQI